LLSSSQGVWRHLVRLAVGASHGADDGRRAGHLPHVAGELAGVVGRDGRRLLAGFVHDLDLARLDDEEPAVAVAGCEELLPGVEAPENGQWQRPSAASWPSLNFGKAMLCGSCSIT
jgi:hypothetical protein